MKSRLIVLLCTMISPVLALAQSPGDFFNENFLSERHLVKGDFKNEMAKYDLARIWTTTDNADVFGFIGNNYQRLRIKFISVEKDGTHPLQYHVSGKSMVKTNICAFKGELNISGIRKQKVVSYGVAHEYKKKGIVGQYTIKGDYLLREDKTQNHSGVFKGRFQSEFYLTKDGKVHYDDIEIVSDSYINNQFIGIWVSYNNKEYKTCNWGDYRMPNSKDLDIGSGDFSPDDKYLQFGWKNIRDQDLPGIAGKRAKAEEKRAWWK